MKATVPLAAVWPRALRLLVPLTVLTAVFLLTAGTAFAIVSWQGYDWEELNTVEVNSEGNLVVTNDGSDIPSARRDTSAEFRAQSVQSITFSFIDTGPGTVGGGVLLEDEDAAALTTFGVVPGFDEYQVFRLGLGVNEQASTGVARTAGEHTLQLVLLPDGSIEYLLDGVLVFTSSYFGMDKFGDVYLRARGGGEGDDVVYTSYLESDSYVSPAASPLNFAFFFGNCDVRNGPFATLLSFGCRGIGFFFGDFDAGSLGYAIRQQAYEKLGTMNVAVVHVYAFQLGSPFVQPIVGSLGSCGDPEPFEPSEVGNGGVGLGGLWIAWFTIEICDEVNYD